MGRTNLLDCLNQQKTQKGTRKQPQDFNLTSESQTMGV